MDARWRHGVVLVLSLLLTILLHQASAGQPSAAPVPRPGPGHAPGPRAEVRSIGISGNAAFTTREILSWLALRPGVPFSDTVLAADLQRIAAGYRSKGYLAAGAAPRVVPAGGDSAAAVEVAIAIREGPLSVIRSVLLKGVTRFPVRALTERLEADRGRPFRGDPLNEAELERDISEILSLYEAQGYPFVRCDVEALSLVPGAGADSLDVTLAVTEGERFAIDEIRVEGTHETHPDVVVRETRLTPGELYSPARINAVRRRLSRLDIFSSVAEPELYMRGERGGLLITVEEGSPNTFDGIVGYMPGAAPGERGYLTGLVSVSMRNLFGTGRKLAVQWQKENRSSQELSLRYVEPWLFGLPVNVGGGFYQRQQDSAYVLRTLDLRGELMLTDALQCALFVRADRTIPSADSSLRRTVRSTTASLGGSVVYDTRDDNLSPISGARYRVEYSYGRRRIAAESGPDVNASAPLQRFDLDLDLFIPSVARQVVALGLHGHEVRGGSLGESEMIRFGGTNTLRGYRENEFLGARVVWSNIEYRLLLSRRSFVAGFLDLGYYARPEDPLRALPAAEAFKYGYGLGVRTDTPLGNLGVSFALGKGDSFGRGKVHIGLINDF